MKDEKYLHQFRVVAEHKCISTACNELYLSQSALTKNIKKVEDRLGVQLFERLPRGVKITEYGEALLNRVKKMELEYNYAIKEIASIKSGIRARIRVGAGLVWGESILPEVIHEFYDRYPAAEIDVIGGSVNELANDLIEGRLDVLLGGLDYMFHPTDKICNLPLTRTSHVVVASSDHPLAQLESISPADLTGYSWVMYQQGMKPNNHINHFLSRNSLPPAKVAMHTTYLDIAVSMMHKKACLISVPAQQAEKMLPKSLVTLPLNKPFWDVDTGVWATEASMETPAMKDFIDVLQKHLNVN